MKFKIGDYVKPSTWKGSGVIVDISTTHNTYAVIWDEVNPHSSVVNNKVYYYAYEQLILDKEKMREIKLNSLLEC